MWELNKHLQPKEKIIFEENPAYIGFFWLFVFAVLFIWTIVIPILIVLMVVLTVSSTKYALTNKRVIGRFGILSEDFKSATPKFITSIEVQQSITGKIFNFGTISIETAGSGQKVDFKWRYVKDPITVKNKIEKYIK